MSISLLIPLWPEIVENDFVSVPLAIPGDSGANIPPAKAGMAFNLYGHDVRAGLL